MALNFRLSYTNGIEFVDMFPSTDVRGITDGANIYGTQVVNLTIPAVSEVPVTQTISLATTPEMVNSQFDVYLLSEGEQAVKDFSTINQIEITTNQVNITRLYVAPESDIQVALLFYIQRG